MERLILHVDVNNAFLSWTAANRLANGEVLDIRTVPSIIGGDEEKRRGIVLAKSTPAKKLGINTADPIYFAKQKCKDLLIFQGEHDIYERYSNDLYYLLSEYTDRIERFSIDECFMDMSSCLLGRTIDEIAAEILKKVSTELKFTVNIGISNNKLLAKMASDFEKPNKIHTLYPNEIKKKMWQLPVIELFMVGKKSIEKLNSMKIQTIGDLAKVDEKILVNRFGKMGVMMHNYANGIDKSDVIYTRQKPKGVSNETTLSQDLTNYNEIGEYLLSLTEKTMYRLRKENMSATVVSIKIKTKDFDIFTRQKKLLQATDSTKEVYRAAKELLKELIENRFIRLIGIRVDGLVDNDESQLSIFDTNNKEKQKKVDKIVDEIKDRFGYNIIKKAGEMKNRS